MSQWWVENQAQHQQAGARGPRGEMASVGQRIGAALIDGLLFFIVFVVPTVLANLRDVAAGEPAPSPSVGWILLSTLVGLAYGIIPIAVFGRGVGKHLMRIEVTSIDHAGPPGWRAAVIRYGVYTLFPLSLLAYSLPVQPLVMLWTIALLVSLVADDNNRGLHDKAAGTFVRVRGR